MLPFMDIQAAYMLGSLQIHRSGMLSQFFSHGIYFMISKIVFFFLEIFNFDTFLQIL